jgi:hypothetical protein
MGDQLNTIISTAASKAQAEGIQATFVDVSPYFNYHRLCEKSDPSTWWIRPISGFADINNKTPDFDSGSIHPTSDGQLAYESAFEDAGVGK